MIVAQLFGGSYDGEVVRPNWPDETCFLLTEPLDIVMPIGSVPSDNRIHRYRYSGRKDQEGRLIYRSY